MVRETLLSSHFKTVTKNISPDARFLYSLEEVSKYQPSKALTTLKLLTIN